jgi:perosamine synthetase
LNTEYIPVAKPIIGDGEVAAVERVLRSGALAQGSEVAAFEREFSAGVVNGMECVAVNSGTAGLHLGLLAHGVSSGDEIIVPSFTFAATANAVALTGATPVFVDIDPSTYCLDPAAVENAVTAQTRGIIPVHLYGHPANMPSILRTAATHDLHVYEDAAQAHGASIGGRRVGTFGKFGMFSLYPTKNITSGEGGMVSCLDSQTARTIRLLRNQGMEQRYENVLVGFNCRMTDIHAAIGRTQLAKLERWTGQRQATARLYNENLEGVSTPAVSAGFSHVYHQYTVRIPEDRDGFATALVKEHKVGTGIYYPTPTHRLQSFNQTLDLPHTEEASATVLSLPVHPGLSDSDIDRVVRAVNAVAKAGA